MTNINIKRAGQSILPRRSVSLSGLNAITMAMVKNTTEYRSCPAAFPPSPTRGRSVISKEVPAVLGIARNGPIDR